MRFKLIIILLFLLNVSAWTYPFLPTVKSFVKSEYNAGRQNWAIDFDSYGSMYFGNNQGLLHYSYESWELYQTKTKDNVRSIYVLNDTIWVGGNIELGYFFTGDNNSLEYKNVADINRGQVWRIEHLKGDIYAQTEAGVFIHNIIDGSTKFINDGVGCFNICAFGDDIWEIDRQFNIGKIIDGEFVAVAEIPKNNQINIVDLFVHKNRLQVAFEDGVILSYDKQGNYKEIQLPQSIVESSIFKVGSYQDDILMIATITDGIILYDTSSEEIVVKVNTKNGLADNTVLSLKKDNQGNLWAGLDYGIGFIENQRILKPIFKGAASYDFKVYGDTSLIATNKGLFTSASKNDFQLLDEIHGQVWKLVPNKKGFFVCHNQGIFQYDFNGRVKEAFSNTGVLDVVNYEGTNKYIVSAYTGLLFMEYVNGKFVEIGNLYYWGNPKIAYDHENYAIWAKSNDGELKKYTLINNERSIDTQVYEGQTDFFDVNNKTFFYNGEYLSHLQNEDFIEIDYYPYSQIRGKNITKLSANLEEDKICYIKDNQIEYLLYLSDGNFYSFGNALSSLESRMLKGSELISFNGEDLWIGTDRGIENFEPNTNVKYQQNLKPFVAKLIVNGDEGLRTYYYPYLTHDLSLAKAPLDLNMHFGINKGSRDIIEYRYQLSPYENKWSEWTFDKQKGYSKLPGGNYTLMIEARVNKGKVFEDKLSINIGKRWFETNLLYLVIFAIVLIFIIALTALYKYLSNKKINRLKEIHRLESYEETIKSRNEQLLKYTEVLSNKNMFLRGIKEDLSLVKHKLAERSVRKIDTELNSNNKDLIFHNLFSELHQDFISRLNESYDALTSHDIRFLSLIRLNLSNEQIANMMNISPKSVNVTRYRIRKKMNLDHEVDLDKFILEF